MPTDAQTFSAVVERTYSLEEAAALICGGSSPANLQWLIQRLRGTAEPKLPGYKVARRWRMTQTDISTAIEILRPRQSAPAMTSMTAASRRRMAI